MTASAFFKPQALALQYNQITHVGLCTVDPGDDNDPDAEVKVLAWPSYQRVPIEAGSFWSNPARLSDDAWEIENLAQINFPLNDGPENVLVTYIGYWDAEDEGNLIARVAMATPKVLEPGDGAACAIGSLRLRVR